MRNLDSRLRRLESRQGGDFFADVLELIAAGRFYDELDDAVRERYAIFLGADRAALEDCEVAVNGALHFQLERRKPKPTAAELHEIAAEIEKKLKG